MKTGAPTPPAPRTSLEPQPSPQPGHRGGFGARWVHLIVDLIVLAVIFGVLLSYFRPSLLLSNRTPTGGDWAGHIYGPWYLKSQLLPKGLISGWSPGWYAGLPLFHFYFPLVATFQALLAFAIPYNVAFKIGAILGTFFLPVAVYLMFRLLRFDFPTPIVGAVLTLGFLFMRSFSIYGGNIPSSLSGEYAYSLSLGLSLVFLALAYQVATEKKGHPLIAAAVLAATALSHLVPIIIVLTTVPLLAVLATREHGWRQAALRLGSIFGLGFALAAFWAIPFGARLQYSANLHWHQMRHVGLLAPRELWIYLALAAGGALLALFSLDRRFLLLLIPAVASIVLFAFVPEGARLFNGRFLPFWYLAVILAAAYLVGSLTTVIGRVLAGWRWRSIGERLHLRTAIGLVVVGLAVGTMSSNILGARKKSYIDDWIRWNLEGFEGKADWPELRSLFDDVRRLPPGRVMWEPSPDYNRFGSPDALMALPYFAGHPTMEGIYYESSITTDYHFVMASEVADRPSNPWPGLPYGSFDLERGIDHMEMFDVRYFIAWSAAAKEAAPASPRLRHLEEAGGFSIYEVRSAGQVVVPRYRPVVLQGGDWNRASIAWFTDPGVDDVPLARSGPRDWARVPGTISVPPKVPVPDGGETLNATSTENGISFDTNAIGVPHIVRTSYFPNWHAQGAKGPYQVSPSVMVVIPTLRHVTLSYERTWAEWLGLGLTAAGLATVAAMGISAFRRRIPNRFLGAGR